MTSSLSSSLHSSSRYAPESLRKLINEPRRSCTRHGEGSQDMEQSPSRAQMCRHTHARTHTHAHAHARTQTRAHTHTQTSISTRIYIEICQNMTGADLGAPRAVLAQMWRSMRVGRLTSVAPAPASLSVATPSAPWECCPRVSVKFPASTHAWCVA
jgi:hypothetical protein